MAQNAGMDVQHVQEITGDHPQERRTRRGEISDSGAGWLIKVIVIVAIAAAIVMFVWPRVRGMLHR